MKMITNTSMNTGRLSIFIQILYSQTDISEIIVRIIKYSIEIQNIMEIENKEIRKYME